MNPTVTFKINRFVRLINFLRLLLMLIIDSFVSN